MMGLCRLVIAACLLAGARGQGTCTGADCAAAAFDDDVEAMNVSMLQKRGAAHGGEASNLFSHGDWIECDNCDPNNPQVGNQGLFCYPGTADVCEHDPCDPNNPKVANRGWYCLRGTSKVIVPSGSFDRAAAGATVVASLQPPNSIGAGARVIAPDRSYTCVQCPMVGNFAGKWCQVCEDCDNQPQEWRDAGATNRECDDPCDPCAPDSRNDMVPGWFCRRNTADVCVDKNGWTMIDVSQATCNGDSFGSIPVPGSAIQNLACKDRFVCHALVKSTVRLAKYVVDEAIDAASVAVAGAAATLVAEVGAPVFAVWAVEKSTKMIVTKSAEAVIYVEKSAKIADKKPAEAVIDGSLAQLNSSYLDVSCPEVVYS